MKGLIKETNLRCGTDRCQNKRVYEGVVGIMEKECLTMYLVGTPREDRNTDGQTEVGR